MLDTLAKSILSDELDLLIDEIREGQKRKGLRASGQSANSLKGLVDSQGDILKGAIYGRSYFYFQENGRSPGRGKRPPKVLVEAIRQWLQVKGLDLPAYAVAMKIHKRGITVPNRFNPGGVLSDPLNIDKVRERLAPRLRNHILQSLKSELFG